MLSAQAWAQPKLLINEISASNVSVIKDEAGEYDDFIELYNAENKEVDAGGMFLSDKPESRKKWKIPVSDPELTTIPPKGFLLIWCDDDSAQGLLHADFKLNNSGESVYLFDADGKTLIDSIRFPEQYADFTYGRIGQGKEWSYFIDPSPWMANKGESQISGPSEPPSFALRNGFYSGPVSVEIVVPQHCYVLYTIGGPEPDSTNAVFYSRAIEINKNTVVRARAFRKGFLPSEVITASFFVDEKVTVPVVSIVTDPLNLWNGNEGIYTNPFADMEKPANFEYFTKEGKPDINIEAGLKIFGNTSRNSSKQSFAVVAREKYGTDRINYAFFNDKPHVKSMDGLILRGDVTSGRGGGDRELAGERVKNELMYEINKQAGRHVDAQAYQQVVLFINGSYWGLYNLMERKGKDFIRNNHGVSDIDMIYGDELKVVEGDSLKYVEMIEYMERNDLTADSLFEPLYSMIDAESFIDYWIFEIYSATHDYKVNIRMWRPRTPDGKWRWLAFDEDSWGKVHEPTLHEFSSEEYPETIFILGALLQNEGFRNRFINRFADLLNTVLLPENIKQMIDRIQAVIKDEKQRDYDRWKNLVNFVPPGSQIEFLKDFAENRPDTLRHEIIERFALPGMCHLTINVSGQGKVTVNSVAPSSFPWTGIYFQRVPITLTAIPEKGHRFQGWSDQEFENEEHATINLFESNYKITAIFE